MFSGYTIGRLSKGYGQVNLERVANASTVWGDLFNRPVCGFVRLENKRE